MKAIYDLTCSLLLTGLLLSTAHAAESQTLYLFLHVTGQKIHVTNTVLKPVPFHGTGAGQGPYRYTLLDQSNKSLYTDNFPDALERHEDDFSNPAHPKGGKKQLTENDAMIAVPALPQAVRVRFERAQPATGKYTALGEAPLPVVTTP